MTCTNPTTFNRSTVPTNLLTVADWRRAGPNNRKGVTWETAARKYAARFGIALVMRADDTLVSFTQQDGGKVRRQTYAPRTWTWAELGEG